MLPRASDVPANRAGETEVLGENLGVQPFYRMPRSPPVVTRQGPAHPGRQGEQRKAPSLRNAGTCRRFRWPVCEPWRRVTWVALPAAGGSGAGPWSLRRDTQEDGTLPAGSPRAWGLRSNTLPPAPSTSLPASCFPASLAPSHAGCASLFTGKQTETKMQRAWLELRRDIFSIQPLMGPPACPALELGALQTWGLGTPGAADRAGPSGARSQPGEAGVAVQRC